MIGLVVAVLLVAAVIKLVVAACGHHITWRLAILVAFGVAFVVAVVAISHL